MPTTVPLAFLGLPGGYEIFVFGFVALLLFGNRLPSLMRSMGQGVTEFKKGIAGVEDEIDTPVAAEKKPVA